MSLERWMAIEDSELANHQALLDSHVFLVEFWSREVDTKRVMMGYAITEFDEARARLKKEEEEFANFLKKFTGFWTCSQCLKVYRASEDCLTCENAVSIFKSSE